ncbi:MAG: hypothetical protein A3K59_05340 [Euryarchaeota archaeon RBG_19FT_COMBO_69_17]|nr:MAG: hypothetical protein A3K59_05340 [Euryarchaeota archaeon RBG_19FT_COMBO_69_17]
MSLRASVLTAGFGIAFAIIANLAWATSTSTSAPWYSPTVSLQMYSVSLGVAAILAMVTAVVASGYASRTDEALRDVNRQIAVLREPARLSNVGLPDDRRIDVDIEQVLRELDAPPTATALVAERPADDILMPSRVEAAGRTKAVRALLEERMALQTLRSGGRIAVAGPLLGFTLFVAISSSMLIGAEGFALRNYQLNTALLLLLGYGWPVLVAWAVAAMMLLHGPSGRRASS